MDLAAEIYDEAFKLLTALLADRINVLAFGFVGGFRTLVRVKLLNIQNEKTYTSIADHLRMGDELCRGRITPMSYQLIRVVDNIYRTCRPKAGDTREETPLIKASRLGLTDMVWGFIECAEQTKKDQGKWDPLQLSWIHDLDHLTLTALSVALDNNHVEVAKLLLNYSSPTDLRSEWFRNKKTLRPLLRDPKYDAFIFKMLEDAEREDWEPPKQNDDKRQERRIDLSKVFNWRRYQEESQERRNYLEKLDHERRDWDPQTLNDDKREERRIYLNTLDQRLLFQPNNIILHLVSKFGDVGHAKCILEEQPYLIYNHNSEGETPVYVAAREGHVDVLKLIINKFKENNNSIESLFIRSKDKHNALHIAIQNHHVGVVFWLIEEFPQLANHINDFSESPLYLAAERRYYTIVKRILMKCREKLFIGPKGKTTLHAAAISNSAECIKHLLKEKPNLLYAKDEHGWTPLISAIHHNSSLATRELLNVDHSIGYEIMNQSEVTTSPVHIAASLGHCETMEVLINKCLGCTEFIDGKGRNILHVSVESKATKVIEFIFRDESLTSLINQKDNSGNTPIHLLVASNFEMMEMLIDYRVDIHALNDENRSPLDIASSNVKRETLIKGIAMNTNIHNETSSFAKDANIHNETSSLSPNLSFIDWFEKESEARVKESEAHFTIVDNLVLVATLIATASFAAAFTVPGGFDSSNGFKQGTPFLLKKSAFQAFVITNAIAFSCACSVLLGHILLLIYRNRYNEVDETKQKNIDDRIVVLYFLTGIALVAMAIAFVTGLSVVLTPSHGLAIIICVMSFFIIGFSLIA